MRILSIGEDISHPSVTVEEFRSSTSFLDFDLVIWNPKDLFLEYRRDSSSEYRGCRVLDDHDSMHILDDIARRKSEFQDLIKIGRPVVILMPPPQTCYYWSGKNEYSGTGRNRATTKLVTDLSLSQAIPIKNFASVEADGNNFETKGDESFKAYWRKTEEYHQYRAYLKSEIGKLFLFIKGTTRAVGTLIQMETGFYLVLPALVPVSEYQTKKEYSQACSVFIDALLELIEELKKTGGDYTIPEWANQILLPGEKEIKDELSTREADLQDLVSNISQIKEKLANLDRYKILLSGQGPALEKQVASVLGEIGFAVEQGSPGRDDLIITHEDRVAVVEIKGVSKSAAEKHAAQLEKWVSEYLTSNEKTCKGILIVNPYHNFPLDERKESFPPQMLTYSKNREHCLITTSQLLGLYIAIKSNPTLREQLINELFETIGEYPKFKKPEEFLTFEDSATTDGYEVTKL